MTKKKVKKQEQFESVSYERKPTATYNMSKRVKTMMALMPFKSQEQRTSFKHAMIQAELAEKDARAKASRRDREDVSD